jgi:hypothetical protein
MLNCAMCSNLILKACAVSKHGSVHYNSFLSSFFHSELTTISINTVL